MRSTVARIALLLLLIATVGIRLHAVKSRDSAIASFDADFAIKTLITESGLPLRDNPVKPPSILSWAVYFQRPECSEPSIIVPFALNSEALVLLARIAPKQPYSPTFIYLDETWLAQNRVLMFIEWLKHVAFDLVGTNRYLLVWTAIVVAEPTACQPSVHVDWRLVWDKDWNQAHTEKRLSLRKEGETGRDPMFIHEYGWFLTFWALIILLCMLEAVWPNSSNSTEPARRWPVNFGFGILNGLLASLLPSITIFGAIWAAAQGVGALNSFESPLWLGVLVTLVVMSFAQYTFHRCAHSFPILWRVHRVHHCDNHLDASSALRFHPFEMVASALFVAPFVLLFGLPPKIVAAYEAVQIVAGLITHANICVPESLERSARVVFVTPVLHRFHHSAKDADANSNYCDVFSIWDRLFGTFRDVPRGTNSPEQFGLMDVASAEANDF